jgi:hypothetical protein
MGYSLPAQNPSETRSDEPKQRRHSPIRGQAEAHTAVNTELIGTLEEYQAGNAIQLEEPTSQTIISGQGMLDAPARHWPRALSACLAIADAKAGASRVP